jgi:cytoskeletal protein CcmA (bactofilin family)
MFVNFSGAGFANKNRIDGVVSFPGSEFDDLQIDGVVSSGGQLSANRLNINGVFTNNGDVKATEIDCDGVVTIHGDLRTARADIDGVMTTHGKIFEADSIKCDGVLSVDGQISADSVNADGFINAQEIVGDNICIKSFRKSFFFSLFTKIKEATGSPDFSKVDLIEATTIEIHGVHAKSVNGHNVTIGPKCEVDKVDCDGHLVIDPDAKVGVVMGAVTVE